MRRIRGAKPNEPRRQPAKRADRKSVDNSARSVNLWTNRTAALGSGYFGDVASELLGQARGIVEAPPDDVVAELERHYAANRSPLAEQETDREKRTFTETGNWWYHGVTRVEDHPRGSLVIFELHNVAAQDRWMVPFIHMQYRLNGTWYKVRTGDLVNRLQEIGDHLNCCTEYLG